MSETGSRTIPPLGLPSERSTKQPESGVPREELQSWINRLFDFDASVRLEAAKKLGALGDRQAIPFLIDALRTDRDAQVRSSAVASMGELHAIDAADAIAGALCDQQTSVRATAATVLGNLGCRSAISDLVWCVLHSDEAAWRAAGMALGRLQAQAAIPELLERLPHPGAVFALAQLGPVVTNGLWERLSGPDRRYPLMRLSSLRLEVWERVQEWPRLIRNPYGLSEDEKAKSLFVAAVQVLGGLGNQAVGALINEGLKHESELVRLASVEGLRCIGDIRTMAALAQPTLSDPSPNVRLVSVLALPTFKDPSAVPTLIQAVDDNESAIRCHAAHGLQQLADVRASEPLAAKLKRDSDVKVREAIVRALAALRDQAAARALSDALRGDRAESVRELAASALGDICGERVVPLLVSALGRDLSDKVRTVAAQTLSKVGDRRACVPLAAVAMEVAADTALRRAAIGALGSLRCPAAVRALCNLTASQDEDRSGLAPDAADALGAIKDREAVSVLLAVAQDRNRSWAVRAAAVRALGSIGDERAIRPLRAMAMKQDEVSAVRSAAQGALAEMQRG